MTHTAQLQLLFDRLAADERLDSAHIALLTSMIRDWKRAKYAQTFLLNEWQVRQTSKIRSPIAYQQCLKELALWGYLRYFPSEQAAQGTLVSLCGMEEVASAARKRKRRLQRPVLLPIPNQPAGVTQSDEKEKEAGSQTNWPRLLQLLIQAGIQLLLVALNKHLNIF